MTRCFTAGIRMVEASRLLHYGSVTLIRDLLLDHVFYMIDNFVDSEPACMFLLLLGSSFLSVHRAEPFFLAKLILTADHLIHKVTIDIFLWFHILANDHIELRSEPIRAFNLLIERSGELGTFATRFRFIKVLNSMSQTIVKCLLLLLLLLIILLKHYVPSCNCGLIDRQLLTMNQTLTHDYRHALIIYLLFHFSLDMLSRRV